MLGCAVDAEHPVSAMAMVATSAGTAALLVIIEDLFIRKDRATGTDRATRTDRADSRTLRRLAICD